MQMTAEKCHKLPQAGAERYVYRANHSITSSARARTRGGMVMPSAFAVLRLMTSANLVGNSTGKSPGLLPFKILSHCLPQSA